MSENGNSSESPATTKFLKLIADIDNFLNEMNIIHAKLSLHEFIMFLQSENNNTFSKQITFLQSKIEMNEKLLALIIECEGFLEQKKRSTLLENIEKINQLKSNPQFLHAQIIKRANELIANAELLKEDVEQQEPVVEEPSSNVSQPPATPEQPPATPEQPPATPEQHTDTAEQEINTDQQPTTISDQSTNEIEQVPTTESLELMEELNALESCFENEVDFASEITELLRIEKKNFIRKDERLRARINALKLKLNENARIYNEYSELKNNFSPENLVPFVEHINSMIDEINSKPAYYFQKIKELISDYANEISLMVKNLEDEQKIKVQTETDALKQKLDEINILLQDELYEIALHALTKILPDAERLNIFDIVTEIKRLSNICNDKIKRTLKIKPATPEIKSKPVTPESKAPASSIAPKAKISASEHKPVFPEPLEYKPPMSKIELNPFLKIRSDPIIHTSSTSPSEHISSKDKNRSNDNDFPDVSAKIESAKSSIDSLLEELEVKTEIHPVSETNRVPTESTKPKFIPKEITFEPEKESIGINSTQSKKTKHIAKCPKCGAETSDYAQNFCNMCGAKLTNF